MGLQKFSGSVTHTLRSAGCIIGEDTRVSGVGITMMAKTHVQYLAYGHNERLSYQELAQNKLTVRNKIFADVLRVSRRYAICKAKR